MTEYTKGFSAGYQRATIEAEQNHTGETERLKYHLAWALLHLEEHDRSPTITAHIAWLRETFLHDLALEVE